MLKKFWNAGQTVIVEKCILLSHIPLPAHILLLKTWDSRKLEKCKVPRRWDILCQTFECSLMKSPVLNIGCGYTRIPNFWADFICPTFPLEGRMTGVEWKSITFSRSRWFEISLIRNEGTEDHWKRGICFVEELDPASFNNCLNTLMHLKSYQHFKSCWKTDSSRGLCQIRTDSASATSS